MVVNNGEGARATAEPTGENAISDSFNAHLQTFYDGLPAAEQRLLQQIMQRAAIAHGHDGDTAGYMIFDGGTTLLPNTVWSTPPVGGQDQTTP